MGFLQRPNRCLSPNIRFVVAFTKSLIEAAVELLLLSQKIAVLLHAQKGREPLRISEQTERETAYAGHRTDTARPLNSPDASPTIQHIIER